LAQAFINLVAAIVANAKPDRGAIQKVATALMKYGLNLIFCL